MDKDKMTITMPLREFEATEKQREAAADLKKKIRIGNLAVSGTSDPLMAYGRNEYVAKVKEVDLVKFLYDLGVIDDGGTKIVVMEGF